MKELSLRKSESGASLIYVLIAATILALAVVMVTKSTGTMFKARKQATSRTAYQFIDGAMRYKFSEHMTKLLLRKSTDLTTENKKIYLDNETYMYHNRSKDLFGKYPKSKKGMLKKLDESVQSCSRPKKSPNSSLMHFCMTVESEEDKSDNSKNRSSMAFADKIFVEYKATLIRGTDLIPTNFGFFDSTPSAMVRVESTLYWRYKTKNNKSQIQTHKSQFYVLPEYKDYY